METLEAQLDTLFGWMDAPWFTLGDTPITAARIAGLVFIVLFVWWAAAMLERALQRAGKRGNFSTLSEPAVYALSRILRYTVWIVGTLVGLDYIGLNITSFALLGGAIGVGIGFGLQNIFSNFISGIIILLEGTLKVGDFVDIQSGVMGRVSEIGMRYTRVTTNNAVDVIVPNSEFINGRVTNWTLDDPVRRLNIPFGVAYGSDKSLVREAGIAAARRIEGAIIDDAHPVDVWLVGFGDSSLNFELVVWVERVLAVSPGSTSAKFLWAIDDELRARGLEIPFPQRDLHVRSGMLDVRLQDAGATRANRSDAPP